MDSVDTDNALIPLVSVVVPIYNVERFLGQCVDSIINQTLKQIEIILVNDGSSDNCPAMCDAYAKQDARVKVIHQKNSGYGKACNSGINAAKGEFFAILEADDFAELDMYEKLYNKAVSNKLDVVRCHYYFYNTREDSNERVNLSDVPHNEVFIPKKEHNVFYQAPAIWSALYKRDFILRNGINFLETPGAAYQDTSFAYKVYACVDKLMLIDDTLIHYRVDNSNSSSNTAKNAYIICEEYDEIKRFTGERKLDLNWKHIIPKMKFANYMWNYRRLGKGNNWHFLRIFSREMRRYLYQGRITVNNFSYKEIAKIYAIAFMFPLFHVMFTLKKNVK